MKKRMLMAGVALAFASPSWAQCPSFADALPAPSSAIFEPYGSQQDQFMLLSWDSVEDATRYTIYWEIFVDYEVDPSGEVVELDEARPSFVALTTVEALIDSEVQRVVVATGDSEPTGWGVTAEAHAHGKWVSSSMTTALPVSPVPEAATAVEAVSWAEVKAKAAE